MAGSERAFLLLALLLLHPFPGSSAPAASSASCPFTAASDWEHHSQGDVDDHHHHGHAHDLGHSHSHGHGCAHDHGGDHIGDHLDHSHHHHDQPAPSDVSYANKLKLPEELAEEEELILFGFKSDSHMEAHHHHDHDHHHHYQAPSLGLWMRALGCSLLVSMASLICLIFLPLIVTHGKPSRTVVDFLAAFGAGAMLGDAFLHQLPHALGGSHGHVHFHGPAEHNDGLLHGHHEGMGHSHDGGQGHAHSIQDLSVGLAVLAGIILFFLVEKIVRQVEQASSKGNTSCAHHHHHRHHQQSNHDDEVTKQRENPVSEKMDGRKPPLDNATNEGILETSANGSPENERSSTHKPYLRKRTDVQEESETLKSVSEKDERDETKTLASAEQAVAPNLILGYLNLFSDGVHNFTDGMALGAAFLSHGTLGGWSRTLFLLAHELPQEVGDFGILVQSGFSVLKALAFNFLSALVALAGTAVALVLGGDPGHSSLIEGFTAGGFIYIAVAGVLPEMHQHGTSVKATVVQLLALSVGMGVALTISLVE